jgi:hypothetical protein
MSPVKTISGGGAFTDGDAEGEGVTGISLMEGVGVGDSTGLRLRVLVTDWVPVGDSEATGLELEVPDDCDDLVIVTDAVAVTVADAVAVTVPDTVIDDESEALVDRVGDAELEVVGSGVSDSEMVSVTVADTLGDGDGVGQFCCSTMLSSPTGPSSIDPKFAVTAMHATAGSHVITLPVVSSAASSTGMRE